MPAEVHFGFVEAITGMEAVLGSEHFMIHKHQSWDQFVNGTMQVQRADGVTGAIGSLNRKWLHELLDSWIDS